MGNQAASLNFDTLHIDGSSLKDSPPTINGYKMIVNHLNYSILAFGGHPGKDTNLYELELNKKTWRIHTDSEKTPRGRFGHTMITHHEFIFLFGGENERVGKMNDLWVLNLKDYSWKQLESKGAIPCPRNNHTAVWSKSKMIVFGGETSKSEILNDCFILDLETLIWKSITFKTPFPHRTSHSAVVYGYDMLVFGGKNLKGLQHQTLLIDFEKSSCLNLKTKGDPTKRIRCDMLVRGGIVFIFGGFSDLEKVPLNDLYIMRLDELKWIRMALPDSIKKNSLYKAISFQGHIMILGGDQEQHQLDQLYVAGVDDYTSAMNIPFSELKIDTKISEGVFRDVYKGTWRLQPVAIKMIKGNNSDQIAALVKEAETLRSLVHPCLQNFKCFVSQDPFYCLCTEWCDGRSLSHYLSDSSNRKNLEFNIIVAMLLDIALGLQYLESKDLVYGTLSPRRCTLTIDRHVKLSDYFLSTRPFISNLDNLTTQKINDVFGSFWFIAPEILSGYKATTKSDVYSLGTIVYELLSKTDLCGVRVKDMSQIVDAINGKRPCENIEEMILNEKDERVQLLLRLVRDCWKSEPDERPTLMNFIEVLKRFSSKSLFTIQSKEFQGDKHLEKYEVKSLLGRGGQAIVYRVKKTGSNHEYAMKKFNEKPIHQMNQDLQEMRGYIGMNHPNVLSVYDFFITMAHESKTNAHFHIVMDFCDKGDLEKYLKRHKEPLSNAIARNFIIKIVDGLNFIHSKDFIHRDMKPQNIFLSSSEDDLTGNLTVKIADLGLSTRSDQKGNTFCGTFDYMAPEQRNELPYDKFIDIWALGIIIFEILTRSTFSYAKYNESPCAYLNNHFEEIKSLYDENLFQSCRDCLQLNPSQRPSSSQLLHLLNGKQDGFLQMIETSESITETNSDSQRRNSSVAPTNLEQNTTFVTNMIYSFLMVKEWNVSRVSAWLDEIGLGIYKSNFEENEIDGVALLELVARKENVIKEFLGIKKLGHIIKLQNMIKMMKETI